MKIQRNIASTLKMTMSQRNISLAEFAEELGIARSSLQEYLKEDANPRADTIQLLSEKLGISVSQLICGRTPFPQQVDQLSGKNTHDISALLISISESYHKLSSDIHVLAEMLSAENEQEDKSIK